MQILGCCFLLVVGSLPIVGYANASTAVSGPMSPAIPTTSGADNFELGQKLEQLGDFDDALAFYRKALDSPDSKIQAKALEAITAVLRNKELRKQADDPKAVYLGLGRLWRERGKTDDAIAAYEKALGAKSAQIRNDAASELATLIRVKTTWWRQYAANPTFVFLTSKPIVLILLTAFAAVLIRACLRRTDLLLIPNPSMPDTQWLPILVHDYQRQLVQTHTLTPQRSSVPLVLFGHAAELFADFLSHITKVDSSSWRQWFIKFFQKPRFELYLSLPPTNQGGIVTAALRTAGEVTDCFIKEFSINDLATIQKDLAFWVAYHIGLRD